MTKSIAHRSSGQRERARARVERRVRRRRWWRVARRIAVGLAIGVLAVALILAYRAAGGGGASPEKLVASQAPDFTLPTLDGGQVKLSDFRGEKNVLLFFNEGYGCEPCWQQAVLLQQNLEEFTRTETEVLAVMVDPPDLLAREAARWRLSLPILLDQSTSVSQAYNALGGMHANKPNHTFVLIDKEGTVRWSQDYASMWVENEAVVQQVRSLAQP